MTILSVELCRTNLEVIQQTADKVCEVEPSIIMEHLNECSSLLGLCAATSSSLLYHYKSQSGLHLQRALKDKVPPSMMKEYIESAMPELCAEIKLIDRLQAAITHKVDALRSMLSYEKNERYISNSSYST
jgi:histone deacetylase complex regulatory component SIN3